MSRHLTRLGFRNTPPFFGDVVRTRSDGDEATIAILQGFIPNQGDAWTWTLDFLNRVLTERVLADAGKDDEIDPLEEYEQFAAIVGQRLGELHALLAEPSDEPDFDPEPVTARDMEEWQGKTMTLLTEALDRLTTHANWPDAETESAVAALLGRREALLAAIPGLAARGNAGSIRTRIHGDLHLGQILVSQGDAIFIDFEGEPARPLAERRSKASPLRDVAGVLRSFDYAAASVGGSQGEPLSQPAVEIRNALLASFRTRAVVAFLVGYDQALRQARRPWVNAKERDALTDLFLVEKAAYEILYETANRPHWVAIPVRGLAALADHILEGSTKEMVDG